MRRSAIAAVLLTAIAGPAGAATVDVRNVMTSNPYGARIAVEDVRFVDGGVDMGPRAVGRSLSLGAGSVTSFVVVAQTSQGGFAYGIRCDPAPGHARVDVENPWTVVVTGACTLAARGTIDPGNVIRWE